MTVVAAHRSGFMVADSLATFDVWKIPGQSKKIMNVGHSLVGCAGEASFKQIIWPVIEKSKTPESLIQDIAEFQRNKSADVMALVINVLGEIVLISHGAIAYIDPALNYYAIGSGADLTTGWLGAAEFFHHEISPELVAEGVKHAHRFTWSVSDTCFVETLDPNWKPKKAVKRKSKAAKKASRRK